MKTRTLAITRFFSIFFFVFGCLEFLFFAQRWIPRLGGSVGIADVYTWSNLLAALVFTASHTVITSERLDRRFSIKGRIFACALPCILVCGLLAHHFGLPSLILVLTGEHSKTVASIIWTAALVLCTVLWVLVYALIERHYCKIGQTYNAALAAYKKKLTERPAP